MNVSIIAYLDRTKISVSIDIGFGDIVYPERVFMDFPVLLDMKIPKIFAYSLNSVIAEKFEAIVSLGYANSRYKDFYDIYILASNYDFDGEELKNAIKETFSHRKTEFQLKLLNKSAETIESTSPPWINRPPIVQVYEKSGARLLSKVLWKTKCFKCIWSNMANVEIQWDFDKDIKKYRFETFCYGPKSCKLYKMGRERYVPYKNCDSGVDDGTLDEMCTQGRNEDD